MNILSELLKNSGDISKINVCFEDLNTSWKFVEQKPDQYVDLLTDEQIPSAEEWIVSIDNYIRIGHFITD